MAKGSRNTGGCGSAIANLPGEIRNEILRYVLTQKDPIYVLDLQWTKDRTGYYPVFQRQPAISQTCRLLRQEALSIYYGENKFVFGAELHLMSMHEIPDQLLKWAQILGHNAQYLRSVELAVNCEILGPKHTSYLYRDFWEIVQFHAFRDSSGALRYELQGDPTFDSLCVCDIDRFVKSRNDQRKQLLDTLLEASRLFFKTTELCECEDCGRQRLREARSIASAEKMSTVIRGFTASAALAVKLVSVVLLCTWTLVSFYFCLD